MAKALITFSVAGPSKRTDGSTEVLKTSLTKSPVQIDYQQINMTTSFSLRGKLISPVFPS